MKINCIIIVDEFPAIQQMQEYIKRVPFLELVDSFDNAITPIKFLINNNIDLIFLDIEMEVFTVIQLIKTLN
ncbi:MAG: DNA-binding response regulator, partial [Weeksellaceae bacterium]|nr:DNA-binding response regulator [Weeksellaceae bacterium]